jgi:hypothetical protein
MEEALRREPVPAGGAAHGLLYPSDEEMRGTEVERL